MIFPSPISSTQPVSRRFALRRPSHVQAEEATSGTYAVAPIYHAHRSEPRGFMARSFSAQLLEMGLRYGIDELVTRASDNRNVFYADQALRHYEQAEANFAASNTPAFYTRFAT